MAWPRIGAVGVSLAIALAGEWAAASHAEPPPANSGSALLHQGDFSYTKDEGARCSEHLARLKLLDGTEGHEVTASVWRQEFRNCVKRVRDEELRGQRASAAAVAALTNGSQSDESGRRARADIAAKRIADEEAADKKEQEAAELAKREAKFRGVVEAVANEPRMAQFILSALLCRRLGDRAEALAAIAKERKYSRIGGVVNLGRRAELQDDVAAADDAIDALRKSLRDIKRPAAGCNAKGTAVFVSCLADDPDDRDQSCSSPEMDVLQRAATILDPNR